MNSRRTYIFGIGRPHKTLRRCWWSLSSEGFFSWMKRMKRSSLEIWGLSLESRPKNDVAIDLCQPGFLRKKKTWHDKLQFVSNLECWSTMIFANSEFSMQLKKWRFFMMPHISPLLGIQTHNFQIATPSVIIFMKRTSAHDELKPSKIERSCWGSDHGTFRKFLCTLSDSWLSKFAAQLKR